MSRLMMVISMKQRIAKVANAILCKMSVDVLQDVLQDALGEEGREQGVLIITNIIIVKLFIIITTTIIVYAWCTHYVRKTH